MKASENIVYLKIKRQDSPDVKSYWETFALEYKETDTLLTLLIRLGNDPGGGHSPVYHEYNCKEEMCGTCTVRVNGKPCLSCSTLVRNLPHSSERKPIIVEPLEKFPVVRDLAVDRSRIFRVLKKVKNWVETDKSFEEMVEYGQEIQQEMYSYSICINCGSCYDACPRTGKSEGDYIGPSAIAHVIAMNDHPMGKADMKKRLASIMGNDGVSKCGKAFVCEKNCPKRVPLIRSITRVNREILKNGLK